MFQDKRIETAERAMKIAELYEARRGADVADVSRGSDPRLWSACADMWDGQPGRPSADLVSTYPSGQRVIEVKGRNTVASVSVPERQMRTFEALADRSWLYVVWNARQKEGDQPTRLILVQDPARLPWAEDRPASRPLGTARGAGHEAMYRCEPEAIVELGTEIDSGALGI